MQKNIDQLNKREEQVQEFLKNMEEKNSLLATFKRVLANSE
jgi:hypothetical protein